MLGEAIDQKHGWNHHQHEPDHQPGETVDSLVEARHLAPSGDPVGELSEVSFRPCMRDHAGSESADHAAAHETKVRQIERIGDLAIVAHDSTFPMAWPRR